MSTTDRTATAGAPLQALLVDEQVRFSVDELSRTCRCEVELIVTLVDEGVLEPEGGSPDDWRFGGGALQRARTAVRLARDLELNPPGVALALDLLDEIVQLRAALARRGGALR